MRRSLIIAMALWICTGTAHAATAVLAAVPNASVVGRGVLSYAFWDVYTATLYAPGGEWNPSRPYALAIEYNFSVDGKDIADRSVQEMRKQGFSDEIKLAAWNAQMKGIFPDVTEGTVLSAVHVPGKETVFYNGNKLLGAIRNAEFGKMFFSIWLDEKTSEPDLRRALLGMS